MNASISTSLDDQVQVFFNIVVGADSTSPMPYIAISWAGMSMSAVLRAGEFGSNVTRSKAMILQTQQALGHLHEVGIVHGDVKPNNIMIRQHDLRVTLIDFGSAEHVKDPQWLPADTVYFNELYRAPELHHLIKAFTGRDTTLLKQALTFAVDVWAYGCVVVEMFRGKPAFQPSSGSVREQVQQWCKRPESNRVFLLQSCLKRVERVSAELRPEFKALLMGCLHVEPSRRPCFHGCSSVKA